MLYIIYVFSIALIAFTFIPFIKSEHWWIRAYDFPRSQVWLFLLFVISLQWMLIDEYNGVFIGIASVSILCFIIQSYWIYPFTHVAKKTVPDAHQPFQSIKIISCNLLQTNKKTQSVVQMIADKDPDILLFLEYDERWHQELSDYINYPYEVLAIKNNYYGMALYSKIELQNPQIEYLIKDDIPSISAFLKYGNGIYVYCEHPEPPSPTEAPDSLARDAELIVRAKELKNNEEPIIVMGDLNDVAWSETTKLFRKISGMLDPRFGRGIINTFHAKYWPIRWPLDHFFVSRHFSVANFQRLNYVGSDHFPVMIELVLHSQKVAEAQPDPNLEERQRAQQKIEKSIEKFG